MNFKRYCLIVMGKFDFEKTKEFLRPISESEVDFIHGPGLFIGTFNCVLTPSEIKDYMLGLDATIMIFEVNPETSSASFKDVDKHKVLFGDIFSGLDDMLELDDLDNLTTSKTEEVKTNKELHEDLLKELKEMSKIEHEKIIDEILDKRKDGKLTNEDKEILNVIYGNS